MILVISILATTIWGICVIYLIDGFIAENAAILCLALVAYGVALAVEPSHKSWNPLALSVYRAPSSVISNVFFMLTISLTTYVAVKLIYNFIAAFITSRMLRPYSNIIVIDSLLEVLHLLQTEKKHFVDLEQKKLICQILRFVARFVENEILHSIVISDAAVRNELQAKFSGSAAYLRSMQIKVILAKDGTSGELIELISFFIKTIALGFYDLLPVSDFEVTSTSKVRKILATARTFVVAALPFLCLIIVQKAGLPLSSTFISWVVVVALAWAAITLVSAIDPLYKSRLQDVRVLMTAIRGKDE
jgi:hypothetical protein